MWKLFCLSVFGCKGKTSKAFAHSEMDSKDSGSDMAKIAAVSKLPMFVKGPAMQLDTVIRSPACIEAAPSKGTTVCEDNCFSFSRESPPCELHAWAGQEIPSQSSGISLNHQERYAEDASVNAEEEVSQGDGLLVQPNATVESGVCAESEVLNCESMKQLCENSSKHSGERVVSPVSSGQGIFGKHFTNDEINMYKSIEEDAIFHYGPDKAILSLKCSRLSWDEDVLSGHISDPGVYQGEEMQSSNRFPVMQDDGSVMHSSALEGSSNPDSHSRVSGEVVENASLETCGHFSEPTHHVTDAMYPMRNCLSNVRFSGSPTSCFNWSADASPVCAVKGELQQINTKFYSSNRGESVSTTVINDRKLKSKAKDSEEAGVGIFSVALGPQALESSLNRVKEWINNIEQPDMLTYAPVGASPSEINEEFDDGSSRLSDTAAVNPELARAATHKLSAYSTVAHLACIGLHEVPSLGAFNCLKTLNLSVNCITRIHAGYLPQSLHTLDLSRNRLSQIEGFRYLARLRVLNLSYNRISRIGHGLANCSLIKELYLAGNKIAEVEGLHRLLKVAVLDLSHNKIATSKALGQLAANYTSLLALNLLGNPVLVNVGEVQLLKLITSLTPHVMYLNKQPINAKSVREAVVDNVAKAALGTSLQNDKRGSSGASRKVGVQSAQRQLPSNLDKRRGSSFGRLSGHFHNHRPTE